MSSDFRLKQHLKMSPNSQIKNLVPENLSDVPPQDEWKLGRFWFNTSIGKLQGVFLKLDTKTGLPVEPEEMEIRIVGADALGPTMDGEYWPDGLFDFTEQTKIADAMDDVNEALKDLAPAEATLLRGDLDVKVDYLTGRISRLNSLAPDSIRMTGLAAGMEIDYIINTEDVEAKLPTDGLVVKGTQQQQFGRADKGIIKTYLNEAATDAGLDLFALFNEDGRDYYGVVQGFDPEIIQPTTDVYGVTTNVAVNPNKDSYKSESGSLTINTVERYNDFKKWQRGTGTVNLTVEPGIQTFFVEHSEILGGPATTNDAVVFYDPNKIAPSTTIVGFQLDTADVKYISGIPFYTGNVKFSIDLRATDAFSYTYWDKPVMITAEGTDADLLEWNHPSSNLNGLTIPAWNDTFDLTSFTINYIAPNTIIDGITVTAKAGKPATGWGETASWSKDILIDTYPTTGNSSTLKETFFDEDYRLDPSNVDFDSIESVTTADASWNSQDELTDGEAQVFMGSLTKADGSYSDYGVGVDYTALVDQEQVFYRAFTSFDKPNSNGILKVFTDGELGTDFDIFLKFPEVSAWLDISVLFDNQVFANTYMQDGTGCGTDIIKTTKGYELPWSIGTFSTYESGYTYVVKVVLKTNSVKITELEEIAETWR